jgi:bleomycin hydrolase
MNDSWFSQYVFEIAARKSALPAGLQSALDTEPFVPPTWNPMGAWPGSRRHQTTSPNLHGPC